MPKLTKLKPTLTSLLLDEHIQMVKDLKEYHLDMLKEECHYDPKQQDIVEYIQNIDYQEWEDVAWFAGYLTALEFAHQLIKEYDQQKSTI